MFAIFFSYVTCIPGHFESPTNQMTSAYKTKNLYRSALLTVCGDWLIDSRRSSKSDSVPLTLKCAVFLQEHTPEVVDYNVSSIFVKALLR